ncbi:MAG: hypothetical protein ACTSUY_02335, partial [Alphaproteobacteria bacterium]
MIDPLFEGSGRMYFPTKELERLQKGYLSIPKKYEKLAIGYTMRIYTNEQAKEYATQGFSRRLKILTR